MKDIPTVLSTLSDTEFKTKLVRVLELVNSIEESYQEFTKLNYLGTEVHYGTEEECEEEIFKLQKYIDDDMDELFKLLIN